MLADQRRPFVEVEHHPSEILSPEAVSAFIRGLARHGVIPEVYRPNWETESDQNPDKLRTIEGFDPNRIWLEKFLSGKGGLPTEMFLVASKISGLIKRRPIITLHRDLDPNISGKVLRELEEKERTGTKTVFPPFYKGGELPSPEGMTGYYAYLEFKDDLLKDRYPGLYAKGNYNDRRMVDEFGPGVYSPIVNAFCAVQENLKQQLPDHFFPSDRIIHRLDPGLSHSHTAVGRSTGIILPNSLSLDGAIESFAVKRLDDPSPFSIAIEVPVMPLYETRQFMGVLGYFIGRFLRRLQFAN